MLITGEAYALAFIKASARTQAVHLCASKAVQHFYFMAPAKELVEAAPDSAAFRPHWHAYSVLAAGLLAQAAFRAATSFCQWSD